MKDEILSAVPVQRYRCPQKPDVPANPASRSPLLLNVLASSSQSPGFNFMKSIITEPGTPEFSGTKVVSTSN